MGEDRKRDLSAVKIPVMRREAGNKWPRATKTPDAELDALIEEATVDAHDASEQMIGFHTMLDEDLEMPFKTEVLGVEVTVEKLELTDDNQIAVICTRGKSSQRMLILDCRFRDRRRRARNGSTPIADGDVGDSGGRSGRSRQATDRAGQSRMAVRGLCGGVFLVFDKDRGFDAIAIDKLLAAIYQRYDFAEERVRALDAWAERVLACGAGRRE